MPAEIENVSGTPATMRNAGRAWTGAPQAMSATSRIIRYPTSTRAGATAGEMNVLSTYGTCWPASAISGTNGTASRNSPAVNSDARPVRAPSDTPAPDSTYVVTDDVPIAPPSAAAAESTSSTRRRPGSRPARSTNPPAVPTAIAVPTVSKKSVMNSAKIVGTSASVSASPRFDGFNASPIVAKPADPGHSAILSGGSSTPKISPSAIDTAIPAGRAARTPRATSAAAAAMPARAMSGGPALRSPSAIPVAGSLTTMPPWRSPTSVMNRPIPTPMESFSESGTAWTTASRRPAMTSTSASTPSRTMHAMATGQGYPCASTMSKATTALIPSPGASANGTFANSPIATLVIAAASAVATATPASGTFAADRIAGLTKRM